MDYINSSVRSNGRVQLDILYDKTISHSINVRAYGCFLGPIMSLFGKAIKLQVVTSEQKVQTLYVNKRSLGLRVIDDICDHDLPLDQISNKVKDQAFAILFKDVKPLQKNIFTPDVYPANPLKNIDNGAIKSLIGTEFEKVIQTEKNNRKQVASMDFESRMNDLIYMLKEASTHSFTIDDYESNKALNFKLTISYSPENHSLSITRHRDEEVVQQGYDYDSDDDYEVLSTHENGKTKILVPKKQPDIYSYLPKKTESVSTVIHKIPLKVDLDKDHNEKQFISLFIEPLSEEQRTLLEVFFKELLKTQKPNSEPLS